MRNTWTWELQITILVLLTTWLYLMLIKKLYTAHVQHLANLKLELTKLTWHVGMDHYIFEGGGVGVEQFFCRNSFSWPKALYEFYLTSLQYISLLCATMHDLYFFCKSWVVVSLRKQPTFREIATWALAKRRLSNERRNSILMMCHYPDLGSASDWLKREGFRFNQSETLPRSG